MHDSIRDVKSFTNTSTGQKKCHIPNSLLQWNTQSVTHGHCLSSYSCVQSLNIYLTDTKPDSHPPTPNLSNIIIPHPTLTLFHSFPSPTNPTIPPSQNTPSCEITKKLISTSFVVRTCDAGPRSPNNVGRIIRPLCTSLFPRKMREGRWHGGWLRI